MATLNEQICQLKEQLNLNQHADNARHILDEYEAIHTPLSKLNSVLRFMSDQYSTLQNLPDEAPARMVFSTEIKETTHNTLFVLQKFTERWDQEGHVARQGNDLPNLVQSLQSLASSCQSEVEYCWKSWVNYLESYVSLEDVLLQSQKNIPSLEKTYNNFITAQSRFRELIKQIPQSPDIIHELQQLREKMVELKGEMQFDLPEEVSAFFKQLDTHNRRVTLAILTPAIFDWLSSHKLLSEYVVSRTGRY